MPLVSNELKPLWLASSSTFFWKCTRSSELGHTVKAPSVTLLPDTPQPSYILWTEMVLWTHQSQFRLGSDLQPGPLTSQITRFRRRNRRTWKFPFRVSVWEPYDPRRTLYSPRSQFLSHYRQTIKLEVYPCTMAVLKWRFHHFSRFQRWEFSRKATWHLGTCGL